LKVSGREVTVKGQQAIEALRTNNSFKTVGIALRDTRPSNEVLARAAQRLTELSGDLVVPLEDEISKAANKCFPRLQQQFGPLAEKLRTLDIPGVDEVRDVNGDLAEILLTDASDAPQRLGGDESPLYENLCWAQATHLALKNGLEETIRQLRQLSQGIKDLPDSGTPGQLKSDLRDDLELLREWLTQKTFYEHAPDLRSKLTALQSAIRKAAQQMDTDQPRRIKAVQQHLQYHPNWHELTQEEQQNTLGQLEGLIIQPSYDLDGLRDLLNQDYILQSQVTSLSTDIANLAEKRRTERLQTEKEKTLKEGKHKISRTVSLPARVENVAQLDEVIQKLSAIKTDLALYNDIEVTLKIEG